jgi:hypothetical protein
VIGVIVGVLVIIIGGVGGDAIDFLLDDFDEQFPVLPQNPPIMILMIIRIPIPNNKTILFFCNGL